MSCYQKNGEAFSLVTPKDTPLVGPGSEDRLAREDRLFCESAKTAAAEYLQTREQILNILETPPIMNGGHYMTKGHVILCLLYIKTSKDVKKYFGTLEKPFFQLQTAPC